MVLMAPRGTQWQMKTGAHRPILGDIPVIGVIGLAL